MNTLQRVMSVPACAWEAIVNYFGYTSLAHKTSYHSDLSVSIKKRLWKVILLEVSIGVRYLVMLVTGPVFMVKNHMNYGVSSFTRVGISPIVVDLTF